MPMQWSGKITDEQLREWIYHDGGDNALQAWDVWRDRVILPVDNADLQHGNQVLKDCNQCIRLQNIVSGTPSQITWRVVHYMN